MSTPDDRAPGPADRAAGEDTMEHLVPPDAAVDFRSRWEAIQQGFVDDPRSAVSDADKLVGDVLELLSERFQEQRRALESQWADGDPDTEDLRSALQRYRGLVNRLLEI